MVCWGLSQPQTSLASIRFAGNRKETQSRNNNPFLASLRTEGEGCSRASCKHQFYRLPQGRPPVSLLHHRHFHLDTPLCTWLCFIMRLCGLWSNWKKKKINLWFISSSVKNTFIIESCRQGWRTDFLPLPFLYFLSPSAHTCFTTLSCTDFSDGHILISGTWPIVLGCCI